MKYDKLVRDRIPEIIKKDGKTAKTHFADDEEYMKKLADKLLEEAKEYAEGGNVEELADVLEVVYAIAIAKGIHKVQLDSIVQKKRDERGAFEKRVVLDEIV
jgi:predicted house-cleaning noncanonical NTP pyrophosphatase (MazG superfamily)